MLTIKDIAKRCNVSPATVSNVMNGKTNKVSGETASLILKTIEELGYKPNFIAKGLRSSKTKIIGVIAEDLALFNVPPIITGITACCEKYGYVPLLENLRLYDRWGGTWFEDSDKYYSAFNPAMNEMDAINADGIVYVAGHSRKINSLKQDNNRPVVVAYSITDDSNIPTYVLDDEKAAYEMTSYLMKNGHRKIGVVAGERSNLHTLQRIDGYQKALFENGILFDPQFVSYGEWSRRSGYEQAKNLIDKGATALFCFADYIAGGVYDYLEEVGLRAGKDISVVGFDNHEYASYMSPRLTSIELPTREIGYQSCERLIQMIEGKVMDDTIENRISCSLVLRASSISLGK